MGKHCCRLVISQWPLGPTSATFSNDIVPLSLHDSAPSLAEAEMVTRPLISCQQKDAKPTTPIVQSSLVGSTTAFLLKDMQCLRGSVICFYFVAIGFRSWRDWIAFHPYIFNKCKRNTIHLRSAPQARSHSLLLKHICVLINVVSL